MSLPSPLTVAQMLPDAFEPKRKNRWLFSFDIGGGEMIPSYIARTATRPTINIEPITIDFLNSKRYIAGKAEWDQITIGLYDPISPSASQKVMEWIRLCHETITGRNGYAAFYKKTIELSLYDPVGAEVEKWQGRGCWITNASFGDLSMDTAEPAQVDIQLRADQWILNF